MCCKDVPNYNYFTMNKQLLIVLMAVCLVSTHAFVKRDATIPTVDDFKAQLDLMNTKIQELSNNLSQETTKNLNADVVKKNFNDFVDAISKAIESIKPTTEAPKPAA